MASCPRCHRSVTFCSAHGSGKNCPTREQALTALKCSEQRNYKSRADVPCHLRGQGAGGLSHPESCARLSLERALLPCVLRSGPARAGLSPWPPCGPRSLSARRPSPAGGAAEQVAVPSGWLGAGRCVAPACWRSVAWPRFPAAAGAAGSLCLAVTPGQGPGVGTCGSGRGAGHGWNAGATAEGAALAPAVRPPLCGRQWGARRPPAVCLGAGAPPGGRAGPAPASP